MQDSSRKKYFSFNNFITAGQTTATLAQSKHGKRNNHIKGEITLKEKVL